MDAIRKGKRRFLKTVGATAALGLGGGRSVEEAFVPAARAAGPGDKTLRVAMTGGTFLKIHGEKYAGDVFTALTGIKCEYIGGYGPDTLARLVAQKGRQPPFDVWQAEDPEVFEAIDQGLVEKANPALVVARASNPSDCNIRAVPTSHGLGMMNARSRWCRARNVFPFSAWLGIECLLLLFY